MDISVKKVPDSVYRTLKREARKQSRSLNSQIVVTLQAEVAEIERQRQLKTIRPELDRFAASLAPLDDSVPLIRADRRR